MTIRQTLCVARVLSLLVGLAGVSVSPAGAQRAGGVQQLRPDLLPAEAFEELEMINVKDADLRDVFRGIAHEYGLNLMVDNRIDRRVTVRLANLPVIEAVTFLVRENDLALSQRGRILRVEPPPAPDPEPPPEPEPPHVVATADTLDVDLQGDELETVMRMIAEQSGRNIIVRRGVRGELHGRLANIPLEVGLRTLLGSNGFMMRERDGVLHVDRAGMSATGEGGAKTFWVQVENDSISLQVVEAPIRDVLREIAAQLEVNLVTYATPDSTITARVDGLPFEQSLDLLFKGTNITYRREGEIYVIGNKQTSGIASTELIRLSHIRADAVLKLLPEDLQERAAMRVVREHNGLMITGTNDIIAAVESYVRELDYPTPQILIEALVVDFNTSDLFELGVKLGRDAEVAAAAAGGDFTFDANAPGEAGIGGVSVHGDGRDANSFIDALNPLAGLFGIRKIGHLPADFFFQIHAMQQEGKANIRSRPQVATLNGHTARISIGTTQYYILDTDTPYQQPGQFYLQSSQRFEKIEANVQLEITPWVSASGEVTAEIRPEFSAPVGDFNPEVPPTINSRVLDSTVRLHDGETIILGGLIQETEEVVYHKVPVLGSIPLLGRLFSGQSRESGKSELVIFLTPHVFYGDDRDDAKWQSIRDRMDLSTDEHIRIGHTVVE